MNVVEIVVSMESVIGDRQPPDALNVSAKMGYILHVLLQDIQLVYH